MLTPCTMHCWKAILKSKETVCWSVSLVEDLESRAHPLTSFLINFFSSHLLGRSFAILEIPFKPLSRTPKPQIKHITKQQKTIHGYHLSIFWSHGYNSGYLALFPSTSLYCYLQLLSSSAPAQFSKHNNL